MGKRRWVDQHWADCVVIDWGACASKRCRGMTRRLGDAMRPMFLLVCLCTLSSSAQALRLRFDIELTQPAAAPAHVTTEQLIRFGTSDLRGRVALSRTEARAVQRDNKSVAERIRANEEYLARMKDLVRVQERTLGVSASLLALQEVARDAAQAPAPVVVLPSAPVAQTRSTNSPAISRLPLHDAGLALPPWLLPGAIGALITGLLGSLWMSVARARNGQVTAPTAPTVPIAPASFARGQPAGSSAAKTVVEDIPERNSGRVEATDWTRTMISRKAADPQALKEVDTLIAFEQFDKAKALLDKMLGKEPDNPEYLLRHYHVRTYGGADTSHDDAEILRAMMDGPMSDTMTRVREIGRGLMPGDPLFDNQEGRDQALKVLKGVPGTPSVEAPRDAPSLALGPATFLPADQNTKS